MRDKNKNPVDTQTEGKKSLKTELTGGLVTTGKLLERAGKSERDQIMESSRYPNGPFPKKRGAIKNGKGKIWLKKRL